MVVIHAHQQSAETAKRGRDGEDGAIDCIDVHAHLQRRVAVLGGRAHGQAELGEAQERVEKRCANDPDGGDEKIHRPDRNASDREPPIRQVARDGARVGRANELHELIEHETQPDRRQERRDASLALQRPKGDALDTHPEKRADDEHDRHRHRQGRVQKGDRRPPDIGSDRVDGAMGEIDQIGDAEDQREAHRQQRVDVADDKTVDCIVDERAQGFSSRVGESELHHRDESHDDARVRGRNECAVKSRRASSRPTACTGRS